MKKFIALALALVLVVALTVSVTVAYLTSTDSDINTFVVGNIEITQYEKDRNYVDLSNPSNLKLMPVIHIGSGNYPTAETKFYLKDYTNLDVEANLPADQRWAGIWDAPNVVDKMVSVTNSGKNDCYVRTIIATPVDMDELIVENVVTGNTWEHQNNVATANIEGVNYYLDVYTYKRDNGILESQKSTGPSLLQVLMKSDVDYTNIPDKFVNNFNILVASQAVQADGWAQADSLKGKNALTIADTALDQAFGEITTSNHPWVD